jgi:hypothetical protein
VTQKQDVMWKQEIHKLLETNEIAFESIENNSVFELLFIPQNQLYLHLIDLQTFQNNALPNNYFQDFSDKINSQNQRIIHLWEDVYLSKTELVNSRILTMLGSFTRLHARHCFVERIDKPTADKFLEINHLQGSVKAKFKYGLFLKPQYVERFIGGVVCRNTENGIQTSQPKLIAVATFSGARTMKIGERAGTRSFELIRFATLQNYVVVGGMDKLLKAFIKEHQPDDIMSYADRDWSDGRSYEKLGFTKIENTLPQTFYINLKTLERLPINLPPEDEYLKIFNTGSIKYIKYVQSFI